MTCFEDKCFVIAPLGAPTSDTRKTSDVVLRHIIAPACEFHHLLAIRADQINTAGLISTQILEYLENTPLAVADLSSVNPNVMYELAFRHARRLPVIQIAEIGTVLPFDIAGQRTVFFELADPDNVERAREAVKEQLASARANPRGFTSPLAIPYDRTDFLTDEQTRNLVQLHQGNAAHRIYSVIDETLTEYEDNPESFDPEHFFLRIENSLLESRKLCAPFVSRRLGSIYEFFDSNYKRQELRKAVADGLQTLLSASLDANTKRKRLLSFVANAQRGVDGRIEAAMRGKDGASR